MNRRLIVADNPDAVAWARGFFTTLRTTQDPVMGVYWLEKEGSQRALIEMFKAAARLSVHHMMAVIEEAEIGWDLPHEALLELIIEYIDRGEQMPVCLQAYNQKVVRGYAPKIASTQKASRMLRNMAIAYAVKVLVERFELEPTGRKGSACAIVAGAMRGSQILTHRAVQKICEEYGIWITRFKFFPQRLQELTV